MRAIHRSRSLRTTIAAAVMLVLALTLPGAAQASGGNDDNDHGDYGDHHQKRELTVMTRNLYLGSSLTPALAAGDAGEFIGAVAKIYGTVLYTNFPARAQALAAEIDSTDPDLIGLQEVTDWVVQPVGNPDATAPSFDFLQILLAALDARGLHYEVAAVSDNANIGPVPLVTDPSLGCNNPLAPDCLVTLQDRDVILVNADTRGLRWWNARSGLYRTQAVLPTPVGNLSFDRGWATIDVRYQGTRLRFANTHLETEDFPDVQEAQAAEFLRGPARPRGSVIAVGDFNSAADGSTTTSYQQLTRRFADAWAVAGSGAGLTCCQNETLTNYPPDLHSRIDLVLYRGALRAQRAVVVGAEPFQAAPPLYASDHAGVAASLGLGRSHHR